jgi:ATP-dependent helicase/nuclease subunit B
MQTIIGPFEPWLENAVVDEIQSYKEQHPLSPLLVLVPSTALRQHLKSVLGRQHQLSFLNVHLLTFHQLSLRLFAETSSKPPELCGDLFLEEVLRRLVRTRQPGAEIFAGIEDRAGGCAALWQTLRDLRDGMVDPRFALDAMREDPSAREDGERTRQLLLLFQTLREFCRDKEINDQSDLDITATQRVPASSFLKQFDRIFYYGFYDLTQIQLDFFHAVAQNHPTTLFFPLLPVRPSHDAWTFAERFYERHVQGYNTTPTRELVDLAPSSLPATFELFDESKGREYASPPATWHCTIVNTFGIHDEVAVSAKEVLRLVEHEKMAFHEIGLVARSLDAYGAVIKEIFRDHQVPVNGEIEVPLVQFPLVKAVSLLAHLPAKNFLRSQVIDLLSSPYFRIAGITGTNNPVRPDLWDLASRELAICKGMQEWRRLRNYANRDLLIHQLSQDDESRFINIGAEHIRCLADTVEGLAADLLSLPPSASWYDYAQAWKGLLAKYLGISLGNEAADPSHREISEKILALLDQIAALDAVNEQLAPSEFSETFQHWLERSALTRPAEAVDGVRVLSATAARGLSFRALFILGLNEGVFPRTIREDAFLRDRDRELLERDLGYKVNPKLAAFDEEKLIFTLLVGAAREQLYCSFQRSDDSGRVLAPSWYLSELKRALGRQSNRYLTEVTMPRSASEKSRTPPFDRQDLLLPEELAIRLSLDADDPSGLITNFIAVPELYQYGRKVIAELDRSSERLSGFDGAVGPLPAHWNHLSKRLSPTALESYARCPFQFFAHHVLGLERLDRPEEIAGPSPADYGELGHAILNGVYRALIEENYFNGESASIDVDRAVAEVAQQAFARYERENPVGYALTWECLKEELVQLIGQVLALDLQEMAASGFAPVTLETSMSDQLPGDWPDPLKGLTIRGRMDRIDRNAKENRLRVIDYKFKFGASPTAQDRNLDRAALRGERLQPPFYKFLGDRWADEQRLNMVRVDAKFYYIALRWRDGPLVSVEFSAGGLNGKLGSEVKKTIADLADGIRLGRFYIHRGAHCEHCDVAEICRKNHPPSLWRAENDPVTRAHRQIQDKDPDKL